MIPNHVSVFPNITKPVKIAYEDDKIARQEPNSDLLKPKRTLMVRGGGRGSNLDHVAEVPLDFSWVYSAPPFPWGRLSL